MLINAHEMRRALWLLEARANHKDKRECDFALYCEHNLIKRFFNKAKHFHAIATRDDKLARNYLAAVYLVAAIIMRNSRHGPR
jgi:transposase